MPLPISKNQLDRLGQRLATADPIADSDLRLLQQVLSAYREVLVLVQERLQELGFAVTARVKTMDTLLDKLHREHGMKLGQVQDLAGARLVVPDRRRQDDAVVQLVEAFTRPEQRPPRVRDRRQQPSSGYRAVHVIVFVGGVPVEVQVRTELQDRWAQVYERLGDRWGRAMRYGGLPAEPDSVTVFGQSTINRRRVVEVMQEISDWIDEFEQGDSRGSGVPISHISPAFVAAVAEQAEMRDVITSTLELIAHAAD